MAKYFTLCEFTPSIARYGNQWNRVYSLPPQGILFHDTEKALNAKDITRALFVLGECADGADKAIVVRVNNNTLAATFSLKGFPTPVRAGLSYTSFQTTEWLNKFGIQGWLVRDVSKPQLAPVPVDFNAIYDNCLSLLRLADKCPCPKLGNGDCFKEVISPNIPPEFTALSSDYTINAALFRRVKYKAIAGFEYIPGAATTENDFSSSMRPWDYHDFSIVEHRREQLSSRGRERTRRAIHRKQECSKCAFSHVDRNTGSFKDCGTIASCTSGISTGDAWALLHQWYHQHGFDSMPGFTPSERNFLLLKGGTDSHAKVFGASRRVKIVYGGFRSPGYWGFSPNWKYYLSARAGDLQRYEAFSSYAALRKVLPELPETVPVGTVPTRDLLGCAIAGVTRVIKHAYSRWHPVHNIRCLPGNIELQGASTRDIAVYSSIDTNNIYDMFKWCYGYRFSGATKLFKEIKTKNSE